MIKTILDLLAAIWPDDETRLARLELKREKLNQSAAFTAQIEAKKTELKILRLQKKIERRTLKNEKQLKRITKKRQNLKP